MEAEDAVQLQTQTSASEQAGVEVTEADSQETDEAGGLQTEAEDTAQVQASVPEQAEVEVTEISGQEATDQPAETAVVELRIQEAAGQQAEAEAVVRQQAEADAREQAEAETIARQQAEADAREQAEAEAIARQQAEADAAGEQAGEEAVVRLEAVEPDSTQTRPQYIVQAGDSYWSIAAKPEIYNNPRLWRRLYEANRDKLEDSGNPNLIEPGIVIEIPSLRGEYREGDR
jgi:nucleoid-associated protein YgaU